MSMTKPQAITGVSAGIETAIMTRYPSIGATSLGRALGRLYESVPMFGIVKLSYLLFVLPTAPIGILLYAWVKIFGYRYDLTTKHLQKSTFFTNRIVSKVALADIDQVVVKQAPGQVFFKSADLHMLNAAGDVVLRLESIPRADVFRQNILKTRAALMQVEESLATIQAR